MKKSMLVLVLLPLLVIALGGVSQAGQGRMAGMGDPYGLLADPSDFLTHPAKLATGEGVRFYGYYRFTYTGLADWERTQNRFNTVLGGILDYTSDFDDDSGDGYGHNALLGAAFPLGPGRMGLFFEYAGMRSTYDLDYVGVPILTPLFTSYGEMDIRNMVDDFSMRVLYGLPLDGINLGGEVQFSYRQEQSRRWSQTQDMTGSSGGSLSPYFSWRSTPYDDSDYWEALFKGSVEGMIGPLDLEFTLRGGFIFAGNNEFYVETQAPLGTYQYSYDLDGGVNGWQIGGDLWVRYPISGDLALPFLVRVDYQEKTWDGDGSGAGTYINRYFDYEREQRDLTLTVGGGVDKELNAGTRIAGGIYYNYIQNNLRRWSMASDPVGWYQTDSRPYPLNTEHQVMVRCAGEHEFSPMVALRAGLTFFYGWIEEDSKNAYVDSFNNTTSNEFSNGGSHWGIGASLGGTVSFDSFTLEPFINGGYESLDLDGDGNMVSNGVPLFHFETGEILSEWYIGGGLAILFAIP